MVASAVSLTDMNIQELEVRSSRYEVSDLVMNGLRVRVGVTGAKTFILRKRIGRRIFNVTIGRHGEGGFGLRSARQRAARLLREISESGHPPPTLCSKEPKNNDTLASLFEHFRRAKAHKRSIREIERIFLKYILPEIGDRLPGTIKRSEITRLVDRIAAGRNEPAPAMARAVAAQLSSFYSWARPRLDGLDINPCRYAGRPDRGRPRERVLRDIELAALWKVLDREAVPWGPAIKLLILTGQRRDEVFGANRKEFDLAGGLWTIPSERAKNGKTHLVPLSPIVVALVAGVPEVKGRARLFPSRGNPERSVSGFSKALKRILTNVRAELGEVDHFTFHDLRRTLATGLQRLGVRLEVTEAILNHVAGSRRGIVGVYQRHEFLSEKRDALNAWAAAVEQIRAPSLPDARAPTDGRHFIAAQGSFLGRKHRIS